MSGVGNAYGGPRNRSEWNYFNQMTRTSPGSSAYGVMQPMPYSRLVYNRRNRGYGPYRRSGLRQRGAPEKKFMDTGAANKSVTGANTWTFMDDATMDCLNGIGQGDGEEQHDGRMYHVTSLHIDGFFDLPVAESQTAPFDDVLIRWALICDKQTNGAQFTVTDPFEDPTDPLGFRNLSTSFRYNFLKTGRRVMKVNQTNEGAANLFAHPLIRSPFRINITFKKPLKVQTSTTGATVAAIVDNSLHFLVFSDDANLNVCFNSRIRFYGH